MKTDWSPGSKAVKASGKGSLMTGSIGVKNSPKKTNKWDHKARGIVEEFLTDKENHHFPFMEPVGMSAELPNKDAFFAENRETLERELHPGQTIISSAKIKLQLFPINEGTRVGLEKDGHNPHLELTLRGRKKISSVLKHLTKKWGSSSIVKGEPMLFPYNTTENLSVCKKWTINDCVTTATAVHAAVGSPAIFRLKYGWFNMHEPRSSGIPSTPIPCEPGVHSVGTDRDSNANLETLYDVRDMAEATTKEYKSIDVGNISEVADQKMDNVSADPLVTEPRVSSSLQQPSLWVDSLLNISIGGLLSEASLQGGFNIKSFDSNAAMQPSQIISESWDAFISAHINHPPISRLSAENMRTSILDAEETCHAFPLQKSTSPPVVQTASGKDYSEVCGQDVSTNSFKLPCTDKVNDQDGLPQNPPSGKTQTSLPLSSHSYDDERSLGLTGIKWNDSRGPFDLGMSAQKLMGGDNVGIGGFVK